ncbi:MAG: hypothetical protein [Caudoviricetes sp.]|nr:MAG: hypothetical protein [Caudoviricetes sp.]
MTKVLFKSESVMDCKITVEDVLKQIKGHTFSAVVAGGYCRDVFHGVIPKDIDVCMYGFYPDNHGECVLLEGLKHWLNAKLPSGVVDMTASGEDLTYDEEFGKRINFVWNLPDLNTDIICWNANSHLDIINGFDCNLNQFYLPSTVINHDDPYAKYNPSLQESPVYLGDTDLSQLNWLKDVSPQRMAHISRKHQNLYPDGYTNYGVAIPF